MNKIETPNKVKLYHIPTEVDEQWRYKWYGVRMEYPIHPYASITAKCGEFRTTQENYAVCRNTMIEMFASLPIEIEIDKLSIAFFRTSG